MSIYELLKSISTIRSKIGSRPDISRSPESQHRYQEKVTLATTELEHLKKDILDKYKDTGASFLRVTLQELNFPLELQNKLYSPEEDGSLFDKLLPLCQIAYEEEQNGDPKEHAAKLAEIFINYQSAVKYLLKFKEQGKSEYWIHDACHFELPASEQCDFKEWKVIANKSQNMDNPGFRELLPHAPAIEKIGEIGRDSKSKKRQEIDKIKNRITEISRQYRKLHRNPTPAEQETRPETLIKLSKEKSRLRLQLAELCKGIVWSNVDMIILKAFYECYKINHKGNKILIEWGISESAIAEFNNLERANDNTLIPDLMVNGEEIGYPGYYIKKLDVLSDEGAAIAACLGKITNCCQYIGGAGSSCTAYGINSPNSGFYVLCEGDSNKPSITDKILAQSWGWRGKDGALCLDSIEIAKELKEQDIPISMFRLLGYKLSFEQGIPYVNVGEASGISNQVGFKYHEQTKTQFIDYRGYSDARTQMRLPARDEPYLYYSQENTNSHFNNFIKQETREFFGTIFDISEPYKNNELLKKAIFYALNNNDIYGLMPLLEESAKKVQRTEEFATLVEVNCQFIKELNQGNIDFDCLNEGAYANSVNNKGQSALHIAVEQKNKDKMRQLNAYTINLNIQNDSGLTVLHQVGSDTESLKIILAGYPKEKVLDALMIKTNFGFTVLDMVSDHSAALKIILERCPEESILNIISTYKILDNACYSLKYLKVILEFCQPEKIVDALKRHRLYEYLSDEHLALLESHKNEAVLVKETIEIEEVSVAQRDNTKEIKPTVILLPTQHQYFLSQLDEIETKGQALRSRGHNKAADCAFHLHQTLKDKYNELVEEKIDIQIFKNSCTDAIKKARPELEKHRGWKQILGNLVLAVVGLGVPYIVAGLIHKVTTGSFLFFKTDSASKLDKVDQTIESIASPKQ